jgi:F-type H+-transporting ATPase subunit gamma
MLNIKQLESVLATTEILKEVTQAFENIASIEIRRIKDRVISSREFFHELWSVYSQLRIKEDEVLISNRNVVYEKTALLVVSSDASLTGGIDQRLINQVLSEYKASQHDLIVIGAHGEALLRDMGIKPVAVFRLPDITKKINVIPMIELVSKYRNSVVYYESFVSLTTQRIAHLELLFAVQKLSMLEQSRPKKELIYSGDYIFEPSLERVVEYMENMMLSTALTEVILESRLAQLASRFNAMSLAHVAAEKRINYLATNISRLKRQRADEDMRRHYLGVNNE